MFCEGHKGRNGSKRGTIRRRRYREAIEGRNKKGVTGSGSCRLAEHKQNTDVQHLKSIVPDNWPAPIAQGSQGVTRLRMLCGVLVRKDQTRIVVAKKVSVRYGFDRFCVACGPVPDRHRSAPEGPSGRRSPHCTACWFLNLEAGEPATMV